MMVTLLIWWITSTHSFSHLFRSHLLNVRVCWALCSMLGIQRLLRQRLFLWKAHGLEGNDNNNSSKIRQSDVVWSSLWEVWGKIPYFQKKPVLKSGWESWARFTEKGKHEWGSLGYEQGRAFHRAGIAGHGVWSSEWCLELHFLCRAGRCAAREGGRPHTPCGLLRLRAADSQP